MKIVFFGNTKYSLIGARIIHEQLGLAHIVTLPDHPDKRGRLVPSPLKTFALGKNIPVTTTEKITDESIQKLTIVQPDFLVVEDYGLILPQTLLDIPKYASLNIHHSLLPKYRGSSPAPAALLNGDLTTGVTVMKMSKTVDAGDILAQEKYTIKATDTTDSLLTILNEMGGHLIIPILEDYQAAAKKTKPQNEKEATFTKMLSKQDGFIDYDNPPTPEKLDRMIRAYYPWPTVWTRMKINGKEKIVKLLPGQKLQVEGKNPMSLKDFINGYPALKTIVEKFF